MSITSCRRRRVAGLRRGRPGQRTLLSAAAVACAGVLLTACASPGNSGSGSASGSGPDLSYFKGKTITLVAPDNPGGSFDEYSRLMAPLMGKYLGATVNVENVPAGNTVVGQNTVAHAQPNGLTVGWLNSIEDVSFSIGAGSGGINFDPTDEEMIAAPGQSIQVWVTNPSSGYGSWQSIVASKATVNTLDVTSGTADLYLRSLYGAYGVKAKLITGYESSKLLAAGFLRHDAPVAEEEYTVFADAISAGQARPVLISNTAPPGTKSLAGVPTIAQLAKEFPPKTPQGKAALQEVVSMVNLGSILFAPQGTPAGEVAALQAAAKYALTNASLEKQEVTEGLSPGFISGQTCLTDYKAALAHADLLKPYVSSTSP